MTFPRTQYGLVHGRFQPFHLGHLEYALAALQHCEHLIVGITNPDPSSIMTEATDLERHTPEANPFTFFERQRMIRAALAEAGVEPALVSLTPFPIHHPEHWRFYCPLEAVCFLRLFSDWGREKLRRFQEAGWTVEVLDAGAAKHVSGRDVRLRLQNGENWAALVPSAVATILRELYAEHTKI